MHTASAETVAEHQRVRRIRKTRRKEPLFTLEGFVYFLLFLAAWVLASGVAELGGRAVDRWLP